MAQLKDNKPVRHEKLLSTGEGECTRELKKQNLEQVAPIVVLINKQDSIEVRYLDDLLS